MRRGFVRAASIAAFVFAVVGASAAAAAPRPLVVVEGEPSDPVVARLLPELLAAGCTVETAAPTSADRSAFHQGDALVRVMASAVEVWLVDHATERAKESDVVRIELPRDASVPVTSLRVSEIVRAHLLPVDRAAATPAAPSPPPPPPPAPAPEPPVAAPATPEPSLAPSRAANEPHEANERRVAVALGPVLLLTAGGVPPALSLGVFPEWRIARPLVMRALLVAPLASQDVASSQGRASFTAWLAGAALDGEVRSKDDLYRVTAGAGVAAAWSTTRGSPSQGFVGSSTSAAAAVPFVEAQATRALGARVKVGVAGMLGVAFPQVTIDFAGKDVATWGAPVGALSLVFGVELF